MGDYFGEIQISRNIIMYVVFFEIKRKIMFDYCDEGVLGKINFFELIR